MQRLPQILFVLTLIAVSIFAGKELLIKKRHVSPLNQIASAVCRTSSTSSSDPNNLDDCSFVTQQQQNDQKFSELSKLLLDAQEHALQVDDQVAEAGQGEKEKQLLITMMKEQNAAHLEEIKRYKDLNDESTKRYKALIDELNREMQDEANKKTKPMPIIVTSILGLAAIYILLSSRYAAAASKWAIGVLGVIAGYWLGGA